jgi:hypothetical protein
VNPYNRKINVEINSAIKLVKLVYKEFIVVKSLKGTALSCARGMELEQFKNKIEFVGVEH